ncbi:MAG TPA: ABC transporter substrate-binding protein [Chloroflexota bacterium]
MAPADPPAAAPGSAAGSPPSAAAASAPAAPAASAAPPPLTPVTVAIPAVSTPFLPYAVAKAQGFDRANGLDLDTPLVVGRVGVQSMLAGAMDFSASAGTVLNAAPNQAPVRVLMIGIDKSTYTPYTQPQVRTLADLAGRPVAVDAIGSSIYTELGLGLQKNGLVLSDVNVVGIPSDARPAALQTGAADAVVVTPPQDVQLDRQGFRRLLDLGDYAVGINGGLGTTTAVLDSKPDLVDRVVATALMGLGYVKAQRAGTLPIMETFMDVDADTAAQVYDRTVSSYGDGGSTPEVRTEIARMAAESLEVATLPSLDALDDLRPLERVAARLRDSGWRP